MMKPYAPLICALAFCLLLPGCTAPAPTSTERPAPATVSPSAPTATPAPAPTAADEPDTEDTARKVFEDYNLQNDIEDRTITACVLTEDDSKGMTAVLLYTDEEQNSSCMLGFVYEDGIYFPVGIVANEESGVRDFESEPDTLTYAGDGTATVVVSELATGTRYRYSVTCERLEVGTNFTVNADVLSE